MGTEEPKQPDDFFDTVKGMAKKGFDAARNEADSTVNNIMLNIHHTKEIVVTGYQIVEDTVGKDRLIGAAAGAKAGALLLAKPGPLFLHGIATGAIIGGAVGFVVGPKFFERYRKVNDNHGDAKPPTTKPNDPAP